jgi:hypothetical protein
MRVWFIMLMKLKKMINTNNEKNQTIINSFYITKFFKFIIC